MFLKVKATAESQAAMIRLFMPAGVIHQYINASQTDYTDTGINMLGAESRYFRKIEQQQILLC